MKKIIYSLILLMIVHINYSQATIKGKVELFDEKYKGIVAGKTKVLLKKKFDGKIIKSATIDENLNFAFYNVKLDSVLLIFKPNNYPYNNYYSIDLEKGETKEITLKYSPVCPYQKENRICPICKKDDKSIPMVYGLVILGNGHRDGIDVKLGGCVVTECQPNWYCKRDEQRF